MVPAPSSLSAQKNLGVEFLSFFPLDTFYFAIFATKFTRELSHVTFSIFFSTYIDVTYCNTSRADGEKDAIVIEICQRRFPQNQKGLFWIFEFLLTLFWETGVISRRRLDGSRRGVGMWPSKLSAWLRTGEGRWSLPTRQWTTSPPSCSCK